jgi:hypothetical protein
MTEKLKTATNCLAWFRANYPKLQRNIWASVPCDLCILYDTEFIGIDIAPVNSDGEFEKVIKANLGEYHVISTFDEFKLIIYDLIGKP